MGIEPEFRALVADMVRRGVANGLVTIWFCLDPGSKTAMTFCSHGNNGIPQAFREMADALEKNTQVIHDVTRYDA